MQTETDRASLLSVDDFTNSGLFMALVILIEESTSWLRNTLQAVDLTGAWRKVSSRRGVRASRQLGWSWCVPFDRPRVSRALCSSIWRATTSNNCSHDDPTRRGQQSWGGLRPTKLSEGYANAIPDGSAARHTYLRRFHRLHAKYLSSVPALSVVSVPIRWGGQLCLRRFPGVQLPDQSTALLDLSSGRQTSNQSMAVLHVQSRPLVVSLRAYLIR